ncbi:hypothetical protein D3C71_2156770 [compost metagenome]
MQSPGTQVFKLKVSAGCSIAQPVIIIVGHPGGCADIDKVFNLTVIVKQVLCRIVIAA